MSNAHVDAAFRDILAGVEPRPLQPMVGADEKSTRILTEAAEVLCLSYTARQLLQQVYDLGMNDGGLKAVNAALERNP